MSEWESWVGRSRERSECVSRKDFMALAALLNYEVTASAGDFESPWPGSGVPPVVHWLNGNPVTRQSALGPDGHQHKGVFLPDIPFPRRMWAGSRVEVLADFPVGQDLVHRETIQSVEKKSGRSGEMVFVSLQHDYFFEGELVLQDQQNMVYRAAAEGPLPKPEVLPEADALAGQQYDWCESVVPDPVLLFRYSGVTANSHRIHYDREYVTQVEHYPGLLVHGPLTATLLVDLFIRHNPSSRITGFEFRGLRPLYDIYPFYIMGKLSPDGAKLWALDCQGQMAMEMSVQAQIN